MSLVSKDFLYQKYVVEKVSTNRIAKQFGVHHTKIARLLRSFGITMRTRSESMKGTTQSLEHKNKRFESMQNYKGQKHHAWKGGRTKTNEGYVYVKSYEHPYRNENNCVLEHRLVMENHLGRILLPSEVIHHINEIKNDNKIENLHLFKSSKEHTYFHNQIRFGREVELKYEYE